MLRFAVDDFILADLGLMAEPYAVHPVGAALEERAVCFGRPVNEFPQLLHLLMLGAA